MSSLKPLHYDIQINPDFGDFTFNGRTIIQLISDKPVNKITLNAVELTFESCALLDSDKQLDLSFTLDPNAEEMYIDLPKALSGSFAIEFNYKGKIEENLKGLYKTSYKVGDDVHAGAITQFETEDARRMFPCFDEPCMKATFNVEALIDEKLTAISNTPIISEEKTNSNKKRVVFAKTPKMSTYLLFLGIAEFESIEDKLGTIEVKVTTHPGSTQYGKEALAFGLKSLDFCQKYFDIPYPLQKLDLLGTPDFSAGAMENWGAISFREDYLLTFPGFTTKYNEMFIQVVIAHEITHQWFGNLVSPSIWKYIWLNESFAEYFANKIVDHYFPSYYLWDNVVSHDIAVAFIADAYFETVPIEIKSAKKTSYNIKSIPIIYNKGGAILRMVEAYVGAEFFQKGLHLYLSEHAYDVASSDHLWESLENVSHKPISKLMKTWVLQAGYPLVSVHAMGNKLTFSQQRFTYLSHADDSLWLVPISVLFFTKSGKSIKKQFLLDKQQDSFEVDVEFDTFKINAEVTGFFRVKYDVEHSKVLGSYIKNEKLSSLDSWSLENDMYALFKAGEVELSYYLDFISNYTSEKFISSISSISEHLFELYHLAEGNSKTLISEVGIKFHESILSKINYTPQENEPFSITQTRNSLILHSGLMGSSKAIKFALQQFELLKNGEPISPDIMDAIYSLAARHTNDLEWFLNKFETAKNEVEIKTLGSVFGEFSDNKTIETVLEDIVFTKIPMRNRSWIILRLCQNPYAINKMWKFFIANLDNIGKLHQSIQERVINYIVSNSVNEETKKDMQQFFQDFNKTNEVAKITTEKAFETLEINLKTKKRLTN